MEAETSKVNLCRFIMQVLGLKEKKSLLYCGWSINEKLIKKKKKKKLKKSLS